MVAIIRRLKERDATAPYYMRGSFHAFTGSPVVTALHNFLAATFSTLAMLAEFQRKFLPVPAPAATPLEAPPPGPVLPSATPPLALQKLRHGSSSPFMQTPSTVAGSVT